MAYSGKFLLRIPKALHKQLRSEADHRGRSLNQIVLDKIQSNAISIHQKLIEQIVSCWNPLAIFVFGSYVKGTLKPTSDIDLLIVLPETLQLQRSLYSQWDQNIVDLQLPYSPHFVHLPNQKVPIGSLWLEVALEGQMLFCRTDAVSRVVFDLKDRIAQGEWLRKVSHGHRYWVYQGT